MNIEALPPSIRAMMAKYGWIVPAVPSIGLAYTVGLTTKFNHPEILLHGRLGYTTMHGLIVSAVRMIEKGIVFRPIDLECPSDDAHYQNIASGLPAAFLKVHPWNYPDWMGIATRVYGVGFEALQMVWCDTQGNFPWDEGFEERFHEKQLLFNQPQLYPESDEVGSHDCVVCQSQTNVYES